MRILSRSVSMSRKDKSETDPRGCWWELFILASAMLMGMTTWFSATAIVPQLENVWDISSTRAAWLTIAVQAGFIVGALGSVILTIADRVLPRYLVFYGASGAAFVNLLLLVAPNFTSILLLRFITGVFLAAVYPPAMKAMATWFRIRRGTALGIMIGALTLGSASPYLINGLGGLDWRVVIVATSILTLLGGCLAGFVAKDGPYPFPKANFDPRMALRVFRHRGVRYACLGYFGHMWELYAMWAWFSVFILDTLNIHGLRNAGSLSSLITFVVIGVGAIGCLIGGVIGDRKGKAKSTIISMGLSGVCALSIGFMQEVSLPLVIIIALIWGVWIVADSAQFSAAVTEVAPQEYVGTALTMQLAVGFILTIPTIWLIPVVENAFGWKYAFSILAVGPLLGIFAMRGLMTLESSEKMKSGLIKGD